MLLCLLCLWQRSVRTGCAVLWSTLVACLLQQPVRVCVSVGLQVASSGVRVLDSSKGWQLCSQWTPTGVCVCVCASAVGTAHGGLSSTCVGGKQAAVGRKQLHSQARAQHQGVPLFVAVLSAVACRWQHQPCSRPRQPPSGCLWCTGDNAGCQLLLRGRFGDSNSRAAAAGVGTQHVQAAR